MHDTLTKERPMWRFRGKFAKFNRYTQENWLSDYEDEDDDQDIQAKWSLVRISQSAHQLFFPRVPSRAEQRHPAQGFSLSLSLSVCLSLFFRPLTILQQTKFYFHFLSSFIFSCFLCVRKNYTMCVICLCLKTEIYCRQEKNRTVVDWLNPYTPNHKCLGGYWKDL